MSLKLDLIGLVLLHWFLYSSQALNLISANQEKIQKKKCCYAVWRNFLNYFNNNVIFPDKATWNFYTYANDIIKITAFVSKKTMKNLILDFWTSPIFQQYKFWEGIQICIAR